MAGQQLPGRWTSGLCGCFSDCESCCCSFCCPCVPVGRIVNILDAGNTSCFVGGCIFHLLQVHGHLGCLYTCFYRKKLRAQYQLPEEPCDDVLTDWCCLCCSIAQTYRELKNRNIDPALGYEAVKHIYGPPQTQFGPPQTQFMRA